MEKEYINKKRYEKKLSNRTEARSTIAVRTKLKKPAKTIINSNNSNTTGSSKNNKYKPTKIYNKKRRYKVLRISIYLFILCVLIICFRLILKNKYSSFLPNIFKSEKENTQVINIADYGLADLSNTKSNNIILSDLEQYIYPMLLKIDSEYNIKYEVLNSVEKISNSEYLLNIDPTYNINAGIIKEAIEENMLKDTKYSFKTKNIDSITIENAVIIRIKLKQNDPLFVYNLNLPIYSSNVTISKKYNIDGSNTNLLTLNRIDSNNVTLPKQITLKNSVDLSSAVDMYKAENIDVFFSSYLNATNLLGKYEYNIKSINSGDSVFLLGNPNSNLFNKIEVRKAIAYGINKSQIISEAANKNGISIDIPYIYNNQKYKYDIYAAENALLSSGYKKNNGVYEKYESGNRIYLELNLLVNKDSTEKNTVANIIKNNLQDIGIKLNINSISQAEINQKIQDGTYDLVLADISLNENPDISKLYNHIKVNESIKKKIQNLDNSTSSDTNKELKLLISTVSDDIAAIGIYSKPTYIIYRKNITLFDNPRFRDIFRIF